MNIKTIRNYLRSKLGSNVVIIYYGSRNRKERYKGVLEKTYNNVFIVRMVNGDVKSFSYIDVLTKTIQMCI